MVEPFLFVDPEDRFSCIRGPFINFGESHCHITLDLSHIYVDQYKLPDHYC